MSMSLQGQEMLISTITKVVVDVAIQDDDEYNKFMDAVISSLIAVARIEKLWDEEWQTNLLGAALAKARRRVDPQQYQLFDCYVNKEWPAERVAQTFAVSLNQVYLAKHRVTELIKEEVERIQKDVV
jgi:hypothetical protein